MRICAGYYNRQGYYEGYRSQVCMTKCKVCLTNEAIRMRDQRWCDCKGLKIAIDIAEDASNER